MHLPKVDSASSATLPKTLPQLVSSSACARCDVCCRFPEADSFLRPYFTQQEIAEALAAGIDPEAFPVSTGAQINLVQNPAGEGYVCPAFDAGTNRCGIYQARPLDCQLYQLALMWDATHRQVLLGWDAKCPVMLDTLPPVISAHAERVTALLQTEGAHAAIAAHPQLIGRFQDDVMVVKAVPFLTARITHRQADTRLRPLTVADAPRVQTALEQARMLAPEALAAYAFPYHYVWTSVLPYWWMEVDQTVFVFAQSSDGFFMPLLPIGPNPLDRTVAEAFAWMHRWNGPSAVSRIDHVTTRHKLELESAGYRVTPADGDYLYRAEALAALAGDQYKSHRALCNRVEREHCVVIESYRPPDREACKALYARWVLQKEQAGRLEAIGRLLLEDAEAAHDRVFAEHERLGLHGTVARITGQLVAYTFGYWLTPQTFCVLLEVADRSIPGLAQFLFRETCRAAVHQGAIYINAMDDSGLPGLRETKRAYRPATVIDSWTVTEPPL